MPGSGKSTLGRRLSKDLKLEFLDTDRLIEQQEVLSIQEIIDQHGVEYFQSLEQKVLCALKVKHHLIATGGSAILSEQGMNALSSIGIVVYLKVELSTMLQRVDNDQTRGLVKSSSDSLSDLYHNRVKIYQRWAELTIENDLSMSESRYQKIIKKVLSV